MAKRAASGKAGEGAARAAEGEKVPLRLVEGSHYRITSLGTRDTPIISDGIFRDYSGLGSLEAVVLELDGKAHKGEGGNRRLIPCHMILTLDIVKQKTAAAESAEEEERSYRSYL